MDANKYPDFFARIFELHDIPPLVFGRLDQSSLAAVACVCWKWHEVAVAVLAKQKRLKFRVILADVLAGPATFSNWLLLSDAALQPPPQTFYTRVTEFLARHGQLDLLRQLIYFKSYPLDVNTAVAAACGGQLAVLQWAIAHGVSRDDKICNLAAQYGHLGVLEWWEATAAHREHLWNKGVCSYAANGGHLKVLKWLRRIGCPWDGTVCASAADGGHLEVLKWLRDRGCPWNAETCATAASRGYLEILQWAWQNGCPWNANVCASAAWSGHLEVLKWLRANGCPWDVRTCTGAAGGGHLEVLQWARKNGCPWDRAACLVHASGSARSDALIAWIKSQAKNMMPNMLRDE